MNNLRLCLFLVACSLAFGQDNSDLFEKAPPPIDEALRARVNQFYSAYVAGKYREAYNLVAEEAQDAFMASPKQQYRACEILKIVYSENFTKAVVVESCKGEWRFHGQSTSITMPLTSNWKIVNDQWVWYLVKPTIMASPFSPTGYVRVPPEEPDSGNAAKPAIPSDMAAAAKSILAKVSVDKTDVQLHSYETSKDEVHIRNEMPGTISFYFDNLPMPGFKIKPAKTELNANEETVVVFEYRLDDAMITCGECAKKPKEPAIVELHIQPTGQRIPITVVFAGPPPAKQ
jgi:hypothetical protein